MFIYIGLFFFPIIIKIICDAFSQSEKTYCIITCVCLVLFSGFRDYNVGTDTKAYAREYEVFSNGGTYLDTTEIGMKYLWSFLSFLHLGAPAFFIVAALCINAGVFYIIYKHSKNIVLSVTCYIGLYYYLFAFNGVRQFIGIGLLLFAFEAAYQYKYIRALIISLLAILFHRVSIIGIVFFFLCGSDRHLKLKVSCGIVILIVCAVNYTRIIQYALNSNDYYGMYYQDYVTSAGGIMSAIVYVLMFLFISVVNITQKKFDRETVIFWFIALLCAIGGIIQINAFVAMRVFYLFDMFSVISVPNAIVSFTNSEKTNNTKNEKLKYKAKRSYIIATTVFMLIVFSYYCYCLSFNWHGVIPYHFSL